MHVFDEQRAVKAGHYRPVHRPLAHIEALAARIGVGHLVLVQPSVYGTDNSLLLEALAQSPGRHRGVVVLDSHTNRETLQAMHQLGVRGARFNLGSPVGEGPDVDQRFDALAPDLRALGWHLQWFAPPSALPRIAALHAGSNIVCVLDHLAGLRSALDTSAMPRGEIPEGSPAFQAALERLAAQGAWLKLSGWYRLGSDAPYQSLRGLTRELAARFGSNLVWGSDWPHTAFPPDSMPDYESTWKPVVAALGLARAQHLRQAVPAIYR